VLGVAGAKQHDINAGLVAGEAVGRIDDALCPAGMHQEAERVIGIDGRKEVSPDKWRLAFPTLNAYRDEWLRQAKDFATQSFAEDTRTAIFTTTTLEDIEIEGDMALVRKKFDGGLTKSDGTRDIMQWQTLYYCRLHEGRWKICGFTGYLPNPMG